MHKSKLFQVLMSLAILLGLLAGCAQARPTEVVTIKAALLPVLDTLPIVVAQQENLFAKHGVNVEIIPVGSAPERDQLISTGQADAMVNELISVMLLNQDTLQVQAVRYARTATSDQALFRILASASSGIQDPSGLSGVPVGVSQGTIIEYLTERLLQKEGLSGDQIQVLAVPKIPDRMSLLASGDMQAAMLPEPFSTLAVQQGASLVLDDTIAPDLSFSVISFRKAMIDENPEAVKGFLAAVEDAVALINANPQDYAGLMVDQKLVPAPIADSFQVPTYPTAGVPDEAQFKDELAWAKDKGYLAQDLSYSDNVNGNLLP